MTKHWENEMQNAECRMQNVGNPEHYGGRDIRARAFNFATNVTRINELLDRRGGSSRTLGRQLLRSATSIGANLEEAAAGQSKADFTAKCRISLKEARDTHYWIRLLRTMPSAPSELEALLNEAHQILHQILSILTAIVRKASTSDSRGP